jgi:hypothetical protein
MITFPARKGSDVRDGAGYPSALMSPLPNVPEVHPVPGIEAKLINKSN